MPFGYFLRKGLMAQKYFDLDQTLQDAVELTVEQKAIIQELKVENTRLTEKETALQQEFLQLTIAYKTLQERLDSKEKELLDKQYDVPPQLSHLEESSKLLSDQIDSLRIKIKKWKDKDYIKANKKLKRQLLKARARLDQVEEENKKLGSYKSLYTKIQELNSEAEKLFDKQKAKIVKKKKKSGSKNLFKQQPEYRKNKILEEIINSDKKNDKPKFKPPVFDLKDEPKGLSDLADIDKKVLKVFKKNEIYTFEDLIQTKISRLKFLLEGENLNTKKYPYQSWPIQARLAQKGEWDLIEEYKKNPY